MTEEQPQEPIIQDGVIINPDGSRFTKVKKLRLLPIPKQNYTKQPVFVGRINEELEFQMREIFDLFSENDKANPNNIVEALRRVKYNLENPEVFRIVEDFAHSTEKDKLVTFPQFISYLNKKLGEINSWNACGKVFNSIIDEELQEKEEKSEITEVSLHEALEKLGETLSVEEVKYIMDFVSEGKDPNIVQDEFYYLMTKRPIEYNALANITKSFK